MWLFDRIFRQPATKDVLPEENLCTEIIAFFLEYFAPFRIRVFAKINLGHETGSWTVDTQRRLDGPDWPWHNMIPDITLTGGNGRCVVLIEVKIDAGTTYDKQGRSQTRAYAEYLRDGKQKGIYAETRLIALTRWQPAPSFAEPCDCIIRFNDLPALIKEAVDASASDPVSALATKWGEYIRNRRWTMEPITTEHLEAIRKIKDLTAQIREVLVAAREELLGTDRWQIWKRGKSSDSEWEERGRRTGQVLWTAAMSLKEEPGGWVQMGCFYGYEGSQAAIRAVILVHKSYLGRLSSEISILEESESDHGKFIWLDNVASHVGSAGVWDRMRQGLVSTLEVIAKSTTLHSG